MTKANLNKMAQVEKVIINGLANITDEGVVKEVIYNVELLKIHLNAKSYSFENYVSEFSDVDIFRIEYFDIDGKLIYAVTFDRDKMDMLSKDVVTPNSYAMTNCMMWDELLVSGEFATVDTIHVPNFTNSNDLDVWMLYVYPEYTTDELYAII